jgi:hypothetical protein
MNGAATNNAVPTNAVQPIPVEGYLVQEAGRTAGYFEYGFRVREQLLPYKVGSYLGKKYST